MSSFFTVPASRRKRKRSDADPAPARKRNAASSAADAPSRRPRDESISGSDDDSDGERDAGFFAEEDESGSSGDEDETAAEKRLRLAERYLENIRQEVDDDGGFDARDIDRDLIAERLKEDVAENKGKIYKNIAGQLDFENASRYSTRAKVQQAVTGCALRLPHAWTVSKDLWVAKWEVADPAVYNAQDPNRPTNVIPRRTPKLLFSKKGDRRKKGDRSFLGHTGEIISIAVSDSGRFLATGDKHARLIIWDADTLTPRKLLTRHRDAVTALSFRRGTEQLFSGGADRAVLVWAAAESAYIETLHGHEDAVIGVAGGLETNQETCVSVGSRDRSARLWKVVEENQLVFRSGTNTRQKGLNKLRKGRFGANVDDAPKDSIQEEDDTTVYSEGSVDCVALLDANLFVTGSDNGALSLWSVTRKKPLHTIPLAHGRDPPLPPDEMSANVDASVSAKPGPRLPRYITAIATVPYADLVLTGSWDGWIMAWRVASDKRSLEPMGKVGRIPPEDLDEMAMDGDQPSDDLALIRGIINGLSVQERGERGKDGICVVAAVGKEPRLARWMASKAPNSLYVFEVATKAVANGVNGETENGEED